MKKPFQKTVGKLRRRKLKPSQRRKPGQVRKKQLPAYRSFRLQKRIKPKTYKPLPSAWSLWKGSLNFFWIHKKYVGLFLVVYAVFYIVFVRGLSGGLQLGELKDSLNEDNTFGDLFTSFTLFGVLLTTANATNSDIASMYQAILLVTGSLAFVWLLRQLSSTGSDKIRIRDAYYRGMQQLVPFMLVVMVILIELIPISIAGGLLTVVQSTVVLVGGLEFAGFYFVLLLLAILSLYLVSGSVMALYIVTIPGTTPVASIRASHQLLSLHRKSVAAKLLLLAVLLVGASMVMFLPMLYLIPSSWAWINEYIFFAFSIAAFGIFHIYMYTFYKSLL